MFLLATINLALSLDKPSTECELLYPALRGVSPPPHTPPSLKLKMGVEEKVTDWRWVFLRQQIAFQSRPRVGSADLAISRWSRPTAAALTGFTAQRFDLAVLETRFVSLFRHLALSAPFLFSSPRRVLDRDESEFFIKEAEIKRADNLPTKTNN